MLRHLGFLLNIGALALFFPGIYLPMFNLSMTMSAHTSAAQLSTEVIDKQLSLLNTIKELWQDERLLVAVLIALFSIAIPIVKTGLISLVYFLKNSVQAAKITSFVSAIGKWSMADVFVVAIFLAVLSTNHADTASGQQLIIFGFKLDLILSSETLSAVDQGFYYFTGYCLLSLLGSQTSQFAVQRNIASKTSLQTI